jgi:hypothetical protein
MFFKFLPVDCCFNGYRFVSSVSFQSSNESLKELRKSGECFTTTTTMSEESKK